MCASLCGESYFANSGFEKSSIDTCKAFPLCAPSNPQPIFNQENWQNRFLTLCFCVCLCGGEHCLLAWVVEVVGGSVENI